MIDVQAIASAQYASIFYTTSSSKTGVLGQLSCKLVLKFKKLNKYSPHIVNLNGYLISKANSVTHERFVYSNG